MNDCFYCENGEKLRSLMLEICELSYSKVYLNRDQKHRGRYIVALKEHKTEYFQLDPAENAGYFAEVSASPKPSTIFTTPTKSTTPPTATAFPTSTSTSSPNTGTA